MKNKVTKSNVLCAFLIWASISSVMAHAQGSPTLYPAFRQNDPIIIGEISELHLQVSSGTREQGAVVLQITEQLRGQSLPHSIEITFVWSSLPNLKSINTGFRRIRPEKGIHVLVFLSSVRYGQNPYALEVLDLDTSEAASVPLIKQGIAMESLQGSARLNSALQQLSNPAQFLQVVAAGILADDPNCQEHSECRNRETALIIKRARDGEESQRSRAIELLAHSLYRPKEDSSNVNQQIVSALFGLIADKNPNIREQAMYVLEPIVSPALGWRPDVSTLNIPNRAVILSSLDKEKTKGGVAGNRAEHLSVILKRSQNKSK